MTYATTKIAKFFIEKANSEEIETPEGLIVEGITNLKLQKIIYFAHAYSLVKTGSPLVTENFQARKLGPVLKTLYAQLKSFGNEPIPNSAITDITSDIDTSTLSMLNSIWGDMGKFSASELVRMSHDHGPWVTVYRENVSDIIIPNRIIKLQFSKIFID